MARKLLAVFILACLVLPSAIILSADPARQVLSIRINGVINPVSSEFITRSIAQARSMRAEALVIELDTPGGLDASMRDIVKEITRSSVPVIVYVAPPGARAASAGVFITIAAHIAAMAPGTNIGAAHPVSVGGKMDKEMADKVTNDAAAYIRSLADRSGRNAAWAEDAVRKSVSATEKEALDLKVIDLVSKDLDELLKAIDGRTVKTADGEKVLRTANAPVVTHEMGIRYRILSFITDPSVAYMLMLLGFYGLFFELTNPGAIFPGVAGGIFLILAFYSFQTLPVNYAGLALIIFAIVLFVLEIKIVSHGLLTIGGIISMVFGSLMLFESPEPIYRISLAIIVPAALITALFFTLTFRLAYKALKRKPVTGSEGMVGLEGKAAGDISKAGGMVSLHGELWSAFSGEEIEKGADIVVVEVSGLKLKVKKKIS
ncbi:MAG: nodulation protein NfeD [Nitrospirae bacterium]|nr:nodulation protein NfeD [Nitrospirota bacterium]